MPKWLTKEYIILAIIPIVLSFSLYAATHRYLSTARNAAAAPDGGGNQHYLKAAVPAVAPAPVNKIPLKAAAPIKKVPARAAAPTRDYNVTRKDLYFDNLPSGLDGLKIAQISDIHSGSYMTQHQIHEIFEVTNSLHPNLVTITGDFVDSSKKQIPALYNTVRELKSDFGTFGCLGNHDHYASGPTVSAAMEDRGINMLVNRNDVLQINGEKLALLGVDDFGSGNHNHARLDNALRNVDRDTFKVLLSHRPELFDVAHQQNIDLTLSGHTHGGQIGMDFMGIPFYPIKLIYNYTHGLYQQNDRKLYVNVGVGMVGIPYRMIKPEISLLTLKKGS
ncbi:MAG: metallophosphoesterase [Balneolales bacterium]